MSLLERFRARAAPGTAQVPRPAVLDGAWPGAASATGHHSLLRNCSNPDCDSGWLHLWRGREAPVFEKGWCCSPRCTAARIQEAIRREMDARGASVELHRHRIPLGLTMLEQGWITPEALRAALDAQRSTGSGRIGEWLVRQRSATEAQVTRALGRQWGCPVLGLDLGVPEDLTSLLPRFFMDAFGALPFRVAAGKILYLGFEDRMDRALALAVERMTGLRVEIGLIEGSAFRPAQERTLRASFPRVELVETSVEQSLAMALAAAIEDAQPVEARLVRIHDCFWLRMWHSLQSGPVPTRGSIRDLIAVAAAH